MINEIIKRKINFVSLLKGLLVISALAFFVHFPDVIGHSIVWAVHTFYEATSFLFEEALRHSFGLDKALAQLIVFYFSVIVGMGAIIVFWRRYLKNYLTLKLYAYKHRLIFYWHSKRTAEKMKLILIHSALIMSAFIFLLT